MQKMIEYATNGKETIAGKRVAISGSGNVAQYAALKTIQLGGKVISMSDSKGALVVRDVDGEGFTPQEIEEIAALKVERQQISILANKEPYATKYKYIENARPWTHLPKVDVALPCATQNEVSGDDARALIAAGTRYVAEGSNMGSTQEAIDVFESHRETNTANFVWYAPGKAANLGGVAVSGLEMAQNSSRESWTSEKVDQRLHQIMENCFNLGLKTAKEYVKTPEGALPSLLAGSNIAGFIKVAEAMHDQGDWW